MARPSQPYYVPRLRCPLSLAESISLAFRLEKLLASLEGVLSEALTQILADCGAAALDHFRTTGAAERAPRPRGVMDQEKTWWGAYLAGPLQEAGGTALGQEYPARLIAAPRNAEAASRGCESTQETPRHLPAANGSLPVPPVLTQPESNGPYRVPDALFWPLGGASARGFTTTFSLQCAGGDLYLGVCERTNPFFGNVKIDPIGLMRLLLTGGSQFYRICAADIAHHEVAHFNAYDTPHNRREAAVHAANYKDRDTDSAYRLSSIELFAYGRGHAALLHRLGLPWSEEVPDVYGRRFPQEPHVLNCRFPLPKIAGWDVEERRRFLLRVGRHYHRHLNLHRHLDAGAQS